MQSQHNHNTYQECSTYPLGGHVGGSALRESAGERWPAEVVTVFIVFPICFVEKTFLANVVTDKQEVVEVLYPLILFWPFSGNI